MDRIRSLAKMSVGRGCFFAGLAIWAAMMALIYDPPLSFRTGAGLALIAACVLAIKARNAPLRSYRETELWLLMDRRTELPESRIQQTLGGVLAELYGRYARYAVGIAIGFWLLALGSELVWSGDKAEGA